MVGFIPAARTWRDECAGCDGFKQCRIVKRVGSCRRFPFAQFTDNDTIWQITKAIEEIEKEKNEG